MMELFRANASIHTNPAFISTLANSVSVGATAFTVASGAGASLPSPTGGDYFRLRIGTDAAPEVVRVTARSGDVCTCDALAASHAAGDAVVWTVSGEILEGFAFKDSSTYAVDYFWNYLVLGLGMNGIDNSTTFTDMKGNTITPNGNAKITGNQASFDGTNSYLTGSYALVDFKSSDFAIAFDLTSTQNQRDTGLVAHNSTSAFTSGAWVMVMNRASSSEGDLAVYSYDYNYGASPMLQTTGVKVNDGTKHRIVFQRTGSELSIYVDGTSRAGVSWGWACASITTDCRIGDDANFHPRELNGLMDSFRIYMGKTPPISFLSFAADYSAYVVPIPIGAYCMKGTDGAKDVYWAAFDPAATPTATWPPASGAVTGNTKVFMQVN